MSAEDKYGNGEQLDDLFRSGLGNLRVEPSSRVWTRLSRKLLWKELIRFNFKNVPWYTWLIIGSTAVMVGTGAYLLMNNEEATIPLTNATTSAVISHPSPVVTTSNTPPAPSSRGEGAVLRHPSPGITSGTTPPVPSGKGGGSVISHPSSTVSSPPAAPGPSDKDGGSVDRQPSPGIVPPQGTVATTSPLRPAGEPLALMTGYSAPAFSLIDPPGYVKLKHVDNPRPEQGDEKQTTKAWKAKPESSVAIGLDIAPQIVFYKVPSNYFKYNYTFDLGVQYNIRRFYVQAAAGFTWSSDIGDFAFYYTKRDSIGYIYSVGSFAPDPLHPGEVLFNTKMETVYDSNNYVYDYNTQNTYYYLQFPLIFGFKALKTPKWNLGIEAGALYMLMVKKDEPEPVFYIPDTKVNEIIRQDPLKKINSFGIIAGARLEYEFSEGFFLVVEPTFNYYLNQVQESGSIHATQPYSIGLRTGLWYRININSGK